MRRLLVVVGCLLLPVLASSPRAERGQARLVPVPDGAARAELRPVPSLATADTCIVRHDAGIYYKIDGWVTGNELYKGYCDPALTCPNPYPFIVTEINMPMYFTGTPTFGVSVDVELADNSDPSCPMPGPLVAISSEYTLQVPAEGLYDIWIPLDTPVTVTGPFFAGFFLSTPFAEADGAAVVIDTIPELCVSYNIWDTAVGFIDLGDNEIWNFPGRLVLYAAGVPIGTANPPDVRLLSPRPSDTLFGPTEIWIQEKGGSPILDYAVFEYRPAGGGAYVEIGRDFDPTAAFRDGASATAASAAGLSYAFNFGALTEGMWTLRATVYDTLGRFDRDSVTVYLEPTPPVPTVISHEDGGSFCTPLTFNLVCSDEDVDYIQGFRRGALDEYSAGVIVAGPPARGPHWNAPYAAAAAIELWYDRGTTRPMTENNLKLSLDTLAARLAYWMETTVNTGTWDEGFLAGLNEYLHVKGDDLYTAYRRRPNYFQIRDWAENWERSVLLGLAGTPGQWVVVDGFSGWLQVDGTYLVRIMDPLTGTAAPVSLRHNMGTAEVFVGGAWRPVDLMVSVATKAWNPTRYAIGADLNGSNGWSISWTPSGLTEDDLYFFDLAARDGHNMRGVTTLLLQYNCAGNYAKGDYNNDGATDIIDADYLLRFVVSGGSAPIGGAGRGDANCDGYVNFADVVFFMNYLFGGASEPCY